MNFLSRRGVGQDLPTQRREGDLPPAGDDIIGHLRDRLRFSFVRHLRPAEHNHDFRREPFQQRNQLGRFLNVPDVNAQADDARRFRQQALGHHGRAAANDEFDDLAVRLQLAHIRQQVTQAERGVRVSGVKRGQQDRGRHGEAAFT